jgi:hypothetical protein
MLRFLGQSALLAVVFAVVVPSAHAQYGWGGWGGGGSTVGGSMATGRGVYAAGAGMYNQQTAAARSMNANTAMQWNDYMYAVNQRNAANEMARIKQRSKDTNQATDAIYQRIHDNPDAHDIHSGDALNVVLTELANPKIYTQIVEKVTTPVDSNLVKNINFQYAPNMILISLEDVSARGVPDELATNPLFETDRQTIRALVAQGKKEAESSNQISSETLRAFRAAVNAVKDKADAAFEMGSPQRDQSDNFLKALLGLSKMLERPKVEEFLKGLNRYPTTTIGHLITFMHSFNLRFGAAKTPDQEVVYDQLYPMLVQLRDQAQAQGPNLMTAAQAPLPSPRAASSFFSGVPFNQLQQPPAGAAPPPPAPGLIR